jgi:hypothetical protein
MSCAADTGRDGLICPNCHLLVGVWRRLVVTRNEVALLIRRFNRKRNVFYYFKDRYALELLADFVGDGKKISQIKSSRFKSLLMKPIVKKIISEIPDGVLHDYHLRSYWPLEMNAYRITFGWWGSEDRFEREFHQLSRVGFNLVLQLNFCQDHNRQYQKLIKPENHHPFEYDFHPVNGKSERTLGWARIDIDYKSKQALIEEIQNDWIRIAHSHHITVERLVERNGENKVENETYIQDLSTLKRLKTYTENVLKPHDSIWAEALLLATIRFLRDDIGIERIFYHTHKTGSKLKYIEECKPPKSIYSELPRKFCFRKVDCIPDFIINSYRGKRARLLKSIKPESYLLEQSE